MSGDAAGPFLGVDYGTVRIGLALGYPESGLALPLPVLPHPEGGLEAVADSLAEVVRARGATAVVIGDPLFASGDESPMTRTVTRLAELLRERVDVPVALQDERHTSSSAEAQLHAAGMRWWQVAKGHVDAMAAMSLVRDYMVGRDPSLLLEREEPPPPEVEGGRDEPARRRRRREARKKRGRGGRD